MRGLRKLLTALTVIAAVVSAAPVGAEVGLSPLDRLRQAVASHPGDPDLRWALARKLATAGHANEALATTQTFVNAWPERHPRARVTIARQLVTHGAWAEAADLLDAHLAASPRDAMARFYRGLVFRGMGQIQAANRELRVAGRLEPTLRAETLLARALGLFELGQDDGAVELLKTILELDPTGDTALRARLLLRQRELLSMERRYRIDAYGGIEWDDNVTLENQENQIAASDKDDFRWIWGAGISGRPWIGEKSMVTVGWRYDQSIHEHLELYDLLSNTLFASASHQITDAWVARLDAYATNTLQDLDAELFGAAVRPSLIRSFGPKLGALRGFAQVEFFDYHDPTPVPAFERDGVSFQLGLEHFLPLPMNRSWTSFSFSWTHSLTQADTSGTTSGIDGDYDFDGIRMRALANLELPLALRLRLQGTYSHDRYHNNNNTHFLQTFELRKRRDHIGSARIDVSREIVDYIRFEMYWRGTWRRSNVDPFDYDKHVIGAVLRFAYD